MPRGNIVFCHFCLESFQTLWPFPFQNYPQLVSILDMNSTSFTWVNDSKICDLYRAIFCTNLFGNTALQIRLLDPLGFGFPPESCFQIKLGFRIT